MENREKSSGMTIEQALNELVITEQSIRMGPTDSEPDQIERIRRSLIGKDITPEEAVIMVRRIECERSSHYR